MTNEFFTDEYTSVLNKLVRQIVNDPSTYKGAKWLPSIAEPVNKIRNEVVESTGGTTNEHLPGTPPKAIQKSGSRVQEFSPGYYKEFILYDEPDILFLRELGQNDPSKRGIRQRIDFDVDRLNRRIEARIELLRWQTIFNGGWSWMGKTVSFGLPAANRVTPTTAWSTDNINANNAANPLIDLRYWLMGGYSTFRKYQVKNIIMNGNTARWLLDCTNTRSYVQNALANSNVASYDINQVLKFFIPGCPEVEIYNGWYQTESLTDRGDGVMKLVTSDAIFFIPDGYIFFDVAPFGERLGQFVQTNHLASGSIESPGYGKFLVPEECIAPGTRGGPKNPFVEVTGGVYGGVNLERGFDVLTAFVGT